jgi:hypothetical protein
MSVRWIQISKSSVLGSKILVVRVRLYHQISDAEFYGKLFVAGLLGGFWWKDGKTKGAVGGQVAWPWLGKWNQDRLVWGFTGLAGTLQSIQPPLTSH